MPQFTQLNLQASAEDKVGRNVPNPGQRPAANARKFSGTQKTIALTGSLIATALLGVFLLETSGCSKDSPVVAISSPTPTRALDSASPLSTPVPKIQPTATMASAVRKARQHKLSASSYSNSAYGVSFRYPKRYSLKEGEQANLEWAELTPLQMNFVQPGGTTITAVELPHNMYPGTDLSAAFFHVSVNPKLTAKECEQFAVPQPGQAARSASEDGAKAAQPSPVRLGAAEFTVVENSGGETTNKVDAKYYHVFQNGSCFEFALGLKTAGDGSAVNPKAVDRSEVFRKLNWMLSTVKIQPAGVPEAAPVTPSAATASASTGGGKE
jgi:hypothetical protein